MERRGGRRPAPGGSPRSGDRIAQAIRITRSAPARWSASRATVQAFDLIMLHRLMAGKRTIVDDPGDPGEPRVARALHDGGDLRSSAPRVRRVTSSAASPSSRAAPEPVFGQAEPLEAMEAACSTCAKEAARRSSWCKTIERIAAVLDPARGGRGVRGRSQGRSWTR